jgi:hypothetical protein
MHIGKSSSPSLSCFYAQLMIFLHMVTYRVLRQKVLEHVLYVKKTRAPFGWKKKTVYQGHRKFLSRLPKRRSHTYQKMTKEFNGKIENDRVPVPLTGV